MYQSSGSPDALTSQRLSHKRIDDLFANPISTDKGAKYAKHLFLNLSTLSPFVSGPNSVKIATPLDQYVALHVQRAKALSCFLYSIRLILPSHCLPKGGVADSEYDAGWQHRTSRSINRTWYRARIVELLILLLPPGSSGKAHQLRSLIQ